MTLTERAAAKVKELMAEEPEGDAEVLRVAIQGGGCSGFQYALGFDRGSQENDVALDQHGVTVVVDMFSAPYLRGAEIDFLDGIQESGFKIENPNAVASCGCGHSFTVEDDAAGPADAGHAGCGSGCGH
ncbi:MAG: iron-sulfur cluster insertion protein ErpA [Thermoleophilia bacterium]|nr:iron-sulfur cluster insertion protein ErpA [Thermoleophilia bacterium]